MASAASPASSPRLPSPPPIAEDQIGPASPSAAATGGDDYKLTAPQDVANNAARRIRPGTKAADMAKGPPLEPLTENDSPFQLAEHLRALHQSYTHPEEVDTQRPIDRTSARALAQPPDNVVRELWLYELCRFHTLNLNKIVTALFSAQPPCSSQTCPDMRASEWQYLCAVHDPPKSCCAIDYCCHTLDWAGNMLTNPKHFPSRLHAGATTTPDHQLRQLTNIFRRLYRIFAHAWFQHREVFWHVENGTGLYIFFKTVIDTFNLLPQDGYTIPEEAEGIDEPEALGQEVEDEAQEPDATVIEVETPAGEGLEDEAEDPTEAEIEIRTEELPTTEVEQTEPVTDASAPVEPETSISAAPAEQSLARADTSIKLEEPKEAAGDSEAAVAKVENEEPDVTKAETEAVPAEAEKKPEDKNDSKEAEPSVKEEADKEDKEKEKVEENAS